MISAWQFSSKHNQYSHKLKIFIESSAPAGSLITRYLVGSCFLLPECFNCLFHVNHQDNWYFQMYRAVIPKLTRWLWTTFYLFKIKIHMRDQRLILQLVCASWSPFGPWYLYGRRFWTAIYHKQYRSRLFSWLNVAHCHTHTSSSKTQSSRYDVRDVTDVRVNKFSTGANHFKSQTFADVLRVRSSGCEVQLDKLENH